MNKKQKKMLIRILITSISLILIQFINTGLVIKSFLYLALYFFIGYDILNKAFKGIINKQVFDENFLMTIATLGAIGLAIFSKKADFIEAIAVMLLYQIGELFQGYAVNKSRGNIAKLMDIRPDYANIELNGKLEKTNPDEVSIGSTIVVKPGEKVPLDGIVLSGTSNIDKSALTGESQPVKADIGDEIISGSINIQGVLKIRTTKKFQDSTVSKILDLVENASNRKSKSEDFIKKFARIYTPLVCYLALGLAIVPPLVRILFLGVDPLFSIWIYRSLTFLVISCPCALVISIPLTFFAGIGGASREGILIKGSNYLETLSKVRYVVFDKTGTLTEGVFKVSAIHNSKINEEDLLYYTAIVESASNHPISKSLIQAYGKEIDIAKVLDIKEIPGLGITAIVDNKEVLVGSDKLMKEFDINYIECNSTGTVIHIAINNSYMGHIVVSDIIKKTSKSAIEQLKKTGIVKTIILTGDKEKVAKNVAIELGVDNYYSQLLPQDKVKKIDELINNLPKNYKLAFVGDGINDAPVLSRSDIGIAMGSIGSDAAIEASDVVLMDDNPMKIARAIKISKNCLNIVYQNIALALGIKAICLILGAFGIVNMYLAIFSDVGVMILAILNATRALFNKKQ